jgi:hypothetical protein
MDKTEFIKQFRMTAEELKPLTEAGTVGTSIWHSSEYVKAAKHDLDSDSRSPSGKGIRFS